MGDVIEKLWQSLSQPHHTASQLSFPHLFIPLSMSSVNLINWVFGGELGSEAMLVVVHDVVLGVHGVLMFDTFA